MSDTASLPDLSHFSSKDYEAFYEPSDDSFLLMDALVMQKHYIAKYNIATSLEIGPGSGCVSTSFLRHNIKPFPEKKFPSFHIAIDINMNAAQATLRTAQQNHVAAYLDVVQGNLFNCIRSPVNGHAPFDMIFFNPPYVPSEPEEVGTQDIDAAWAGGIDGREVVDRFIMNVPRIWNNQGVIYLLLEKRNRPIQLKASLENAGWTVCLVREKRIVNEILSVWKLQRL